MAQALVRLVAMRCAKRIVAHSSGFRTWLAGVASSALSQALGTLLAAAVIVLIGAASGLIKNVSVGEVTWVVSFLIGSAIGVVYALRSEGARPETPPAESIAAAIQRYLAEHEKPGEGGAKGD